MYLNYKRCKDYFLHVMLGKLIRNKDKNLTGFKNMASQIQSSNTVICALVVMVMEWSLCSRRPAFLPLSAAKW